jgi:hypothetical protein
MSKPLEATIRAGSVWTHRNGNIYQVLMITNLPDEERYPKTVVYQNLANQTLWSRRFDDWLRSFTPYVKDPASAS